MQTNMQFLDKQTKLYLLIGRNLAQSTHVSYNTVNPTTPLYVNPSLQPLTRKQRRLVTKNPGTIVAIAKGEYNINLVQTLSN